MSQKRLTMRKAREVIRLVLGCSLSIRAAAKSMNVSHTAVSRYLVRAQAAGLSWPLPEEMDDETLRKRLFPPEEAEVKRRKVMPSWPDTHTELKKKGVTLQLLWEEYREEHPDGYSYSRFCAHYKRWRKQLPVSMHQEHKAGEKLFLDYAGPTMEIHDRETGQTQEAKIFVAVLGASSYTYAEAQPLADIPHWIGGHVHAFDYFGGVPEILVPDNLKTGITHPCRYEPDVNPTYHDMAVHYGTVVIPARIRKPKDKAKVEVGVQVVERWIMARLRKQTFFSLRELNRAIKELLEDLNNRPMKHLGKSRRELFEAIDRPALQPLPTHRYTLSVIKKARVGIDYHVEFQGSYYSVPYTYARLAVEVRGTDHTVEIFHGGQRIASHARSENLHHYSTLVSHMPPHHKAMMGWTPERFLTWAESIGPHTTEMVKAVLVSREHPEQGYRSCMGILRLVSSYSKERLEAACERALCFGLIRYKGVADILKRGLDRVEISPPSPTPPGPTHANVRGATYYREEEAGDAN